MNPWDEQAFKEINDLDAARLALRGALATIRDLQDLNLRVKGQVQDEQSKVKQVEAAVLELKSQNDRLKEEAAALEAERRERLTGEERWKNAERLKVREEEKARLEAARVSLEEELVRVRASLQRLAETYRTKESDWEQIRRRLEGREGELVSSQREKIELADRFHRDAELLERLREQRDLEIGATLEGRRLDLESREREISQLRHANENLQKAAAQAGLELENRVREREERLIKEYRIKEQTLAEQFSRRQAEMEASWSELENGLWKKTKDAREKLDQASALQFQER